MHRTTLVSDQAAGEPPEPVADFGEQEEVAQEQSGRRTPPAAAAAASRSNAHKRAQLTRAGTSRLRGT
jgi:hypothetical protein